MSRGEVLAGFGLLAIPLASASLLATIVVRRVLGHLDRVAGAVAWLLVAVTGLVAIHLGPLVLGVASRVSVVAAAVLVAAAASLVPQRSAAVEPPAAAPPPSSVASRVLGYGTAAAVAAWALANVRELLPQPLTSVDTITFHLPNVARWIESGSLWQIDQFIPLQSQGTYPNHGDVLLLWSVLPWDNDFFVRVPMAALLAAFAFAVWALGREVGAPSAVSASVAAALCALPIFGLATLRAAMPDVLLAFALAAAALFLLRHARTGRTSDLVLAGVGLGLGLGTKWYGLTTLVVVVAVVVVLRRSLRDGALLGAVATAVGGVWFLRNLVEVGNPFFPLDTPLFDAPRDVVSETVGFAIADYATDFDVLFGDLPGEIVQGLGWIAVALVLAAVPGLIAALRSRDGRGAGLALCAAGLAAAYVVTPNTALGFEGDPDLANFNTRYALPALIAAGGLALWGLARSPRFALPAQVALAGTVAFALDEAFFPAGATSVVGGALALAAVAAVVLAAQRRPAIGLAAAVLAAVAGVAYLDRQQDRLNEQRYVGFGDPVLKAISQGDAAPGDLHIAIAGDWNAKGVSPVWPSFGTRIENEVTVIGYDADGFLTNYERREPFLRALEDARPDALVVGRGLDPKPGLTPPEQRWAQSAGWRVAATSDRLVLMVPSSRA